MARPIEVGKPKMKKERKNNPLKLNVVLRLTDRQTELQRQFSIAS